MEFGKWLDSLKAGDEVAINLEYNTGCPFSLAKVDRRTPNGSIVVDQIIFDGNDGVGKAGFNHSRIIEPTQDIKNNIEAHKLKMLIKGWASDAQLDELKSTWTFITSPKS
jgi:hypothetical protein